ncbi:MAG: thioredoxin domain-containing protein [Nanoarchaeota archaeon]|nr:thioredoxin domain-containing protein [Nanoarchaeota archaeon]
MKNDKGKTIKLEFNQLSLWRAGTIIFAILFILSFFNGSNADDGSETIDLPTQAAAPKAQNPVDIKIGDAYFEGKKNAKVEIIEFSDFQCPFCARFYTETLGQIREKYIDTGKALLVYKHLPLPFHPEAQKAAEAAECAGNLGGNEAFFAMHDKIFDNQAVDIGVGALKRFAGEIGLDQSKFDSCLDNGDTVDKINAHLAEANKYGASGTPTFFINGVKVVGAQPYAVFEAAIESALK